MTQRGQAMVESLVLFPLLIAVLVMVHWVLYGQHEKSRLQMAAAHGAFLRTHLWSADSSLTPRQRSVLQDRAATGVQYDLEVYDWTAGLRNETAVLASEVRLGDDGLHQSSLRKTLEHAVFPSLHLQQQHVLLVGSGNAMQGEAVRHRLQQAPRWWATSAKGSAAQVQRIEQVASGVDRAWGRASVETDWLKRWEHSVPMPEKRQE